MIETDASPDWLTLKDPQDRYISSGNMTSGDWTPSWKSKTDECPICAQNPPPNEESKEALRQMREGEMNDYRADTVDEMVDKILNE